MFSPPLTDWLPDSQELFSLAFRGRLVRGDVRRHIRRTSAANSLTHQLTLDVEGMTTRLSYLSNIHNPTLSYTRNPLSWIASVRQPILPFALALQNRALRGTPSKTFRSRKNKAAQFLTLVPISIAPSSPSDSGTSDSDSASDWELSPSKPSKPKKPARRSKDHRPLCPLCTLPSDTDGDHPDTWHVATTCPPLASNRRITRLDGYTILRPLLADPLGLIPSLHHWLRTATNSAEQPLYLVPRDRPVHPQTVLTDGFHLVPQPQTLLGNPLPPNTSLILHFPPLRFPLDPHSSTYDPNPNPVLLLFTSLNPLPPIQAPQASALADIFRSHLWLGSYGLLLRWGFSYWALDRAPPTDPSDIDQTLRHFGILPLLNPRPPISDEPQWHPSLSWLGHLPPFPLSKSITSKLHRSLLQALSSAILLGQHESYDTYKKLTAQALQARKRACNPRLRPRKRILFAAFEATKATYPPSLLHHTIALRFLADCSQKPHDFATLQLWSNTQGLHANSVHTLWLAILAASKGPLITLVKNKSSLLKKIETLSSLGQRGVPRPLPIRLQTRRRLR